MFLDGRWEDKIFWTKQCQVFHSFILCLSERNLRLNKIVVISVSENMSAGEFYHLFHEIIGDHGSTVVKVLCYKSEGRWFDPS